MQVSRAARPAATRYSSSHPAGETGERTPHASRTAAIACIHASPTAAAALDATSTICTLSAAQVGETKQDGAHHAGPRPSVQSPETGRVGGCAAPC